MLKESINKILEYLYENRVLDQGEYNNFQLELNNATTDDEVEVVKFKLIELLKEKNTQVNEEFLEVAAEYANVLNSMKEEFKDDSELQAIIDEFNSQVNEATAEFEKEMEQISEDWNEVSQVIEEAETEAEK